MSDPQHPELNPYASPQTTTDRDHLPPIYFAGTLSRDDLLMSLRDNAPFEFTRAPIQSVIVISLLGFLSFTDPRGTTTSILALYISFQFLPLWQGLLASLTSGDRARKERIELSATRQQHQSGFINQEFLMLSRPAFVVRATWQYFSHAYVFPTHLTLPIANMPSRRFVLPWRFFGSPREALDVHKFIKGKVGLTVDAPPAETPLLGMTREENGRPTISLDEAESWNEENWPREVQPVNSEPTEGIGFDAKLPAAPQTNRFVAFLGLLLWPHLSFLPAWTVLAILMTLSTFDVIDSPLENVFVGLFAVGYTLYWAYISTKAFLQADLQATQSIRLVVRYSGVYFSMSTFQSWFGWETVENIVIGDEAAGWTAEETQEDVLWRAAWFDDESTFQRFAEALRKFSAKEESLDD